MSLMLQKIPYQLLAWIYLEESFKAYMGKDYLDVNRNSILEVCRREMLVKCTPN